MTNEQWEQLVERAKEHFENVELSTEDLLVETADGTEKRGTQDILLFENNAGRFKIVRENKPVLLGKTEHFSHRMGDTARTDYTFSETEFSHKLKVYKDFDYDDWDEITLDKLGL